MFESFNRRWRAWLQERVAIQRLAAMDDHLLDDMGASRETIRDFVRARARR
jgi:uncharacterized protein YjiS (DUF1127 family)